MFIAHRNAENELLKFLTGIKDRPKGNVGIYFPMSRLLTKYLNEFQLKIVVNMMHDHVKHFRGGIFQLRSNDIIVILDTEDREFLERLVNQIRYLFPDDPLAYVAREMPNEEFCKVYLLSFQWNEFVEFCKGKALSTKPTPKEEEDIAALQDTTPKLPPTNPLTPFVNLLLKLEGLDLTQCLRNQAVCAVTGPSVQPVFDEIYVSIHHLRAALECPQSFVIRTPLFTYMTEILDHKILGLFNSSYFNHFTGAISFNINTSTLLSRQFEEFNRTIPDKVKKSIIFEIHIGDVFTDIGAFMLARTKVQQNGYRLCLDGLTNFSFVQVEREALGFDLAKLFWNRDDANMLNHKENSKLVEAVRKYGPNRMILARCDNEEAVRYGQALGISLFQGWYIDKLQKGVHS